MLAAPEESVVAVAAERLADAPDAGATNVTTAPGTGLFPASLTITCRGAPNAVDTAADCPVPAVAATVADAPAVLVRLKAAGDPMPATLALMVYGPPTVELAVAFTLATPDVLDKAEAEESTAPGPEAGPANVTVTPEIDRPAESRTVADRGDANGVPAGAGCGVPADAVSVAGVADPKKIPANCAHDPPVR